MINTNLYAEIEAKKKKIERNPAFYDQRKVLVRESIRNLGDLYSFWIENPELRNNLLIGNKRPETIKKLARKGIQSIHNAWYFLSKIGEHGEFVEELNESVLLSTNGLVKGKSKDDGEFRRVDVTLNFPGYTPPSWERVPDRTRYALAQIESLYEANPLESAIYSHLALALIQPFKEGNKRTARLIQDRILWDAGFPPAIISAGESKFYLDLLRRTSKPFQMEDTNGQKQFYNYIASKVNNGLDEILNDLDVH